VFAAADAGDGIAQVIVENAGKEISKIAQALLRWGATRWCLMGGLAPLIQPLLADDVRRAQVPPKGDAIDGALWLSGLRILSG
jgi:glucosamine kinase